MSDSSASASASDSVNIVCHPKGKSKSMETFWICSERERKDCKQ